MRNQKKLTLLTLGATLALAAAAWAQSSLTLRYQGTVVSHGLRIIDGRPYVPLADVARMVSGSAVRDGGGYAIQTREAAAPATPAGGANEVHGLHGTVGQMVFTGKWRFEVLKVEHLDKYTAHFQPTSETVSPKGDNDELVVVTCLVKNAQTRPKQLMMTVHGLHNTALADDQGQSYPPFQMDLTGGGFYGPPSMLPGSTQHFALIFSVAKGTKLKDLVCTLGSYDDNDPVDVRISLGQ